MGNVCSPSFSFDDTISHCLDCTVRQAGYICELQDNLVDLQSELRKLIEQRNDVRIRVTVAEQKLMKRLDQVQGWLSRVQDVETEAGELAQISQQVQQRRLTAFCSRNCMSNYKFGKKVFETLRVVQNLRAEGVFQDVAQTAPQNLVEEMPIPSGIVGLQPTLEKVWGCITEEQAGIIGIHGMGGVGKTTLLTLINNKFLETPSSFGVVIWTVVSKDLEIEKIQDSIAKRFDLFNDSWRNKNLKEKTKEIFKQLSKKKFALLLDDIWEVVELNKVGVPAPSTTNGSKVIFTTRNRKVIRQMDAEADFNVECLGYDEAWRLFEKNVGRNTLDSDPTIPELAEIVAKECGGLPLALITVGRAMAYRETPQEWKHAIKVLRTSVFKFSDIETKVYSCLKLSYDLLKSHTDKFCLLYCSLFSEDFLIAKEDLIDCWICEGFLGEDDRIEARDQGYFIIGTLLNACLLEDVGTFVKMHDVIRDMALWVTSTIEKEKEKFLVLAGVGLNQPPRIGMWEEVTRMSLMNNKIENLSESPSCPRLQTLFLDGNNLKMIGSDFFQSMASLCVLNLSRNYEMLYLPAGISCLVSLQYLNLSATRIEKLPEELKYLVNLKCLNLEDTAFLRTISRQFISNLKILQVLRMLQCGDGVQEEDSVLFGSGECLVEELLGLEYLNVLTIDLRSFHALQRLLSSRLQSSTRSLRLINLKDSKSLNVLSLAILKHLKTLILSSCEELEELKIEYSGELKKFRETHSFHYLQEVFIFFCSKLKHVTWLIFAPNIQRIQIYYCGNMEAIIKLNEVPAEVMENLLPFTRLQTLSLVELNNLKSIYPNILQFPHLKEMYVHNCPNLKKLPLDCNSASEGKFIIKGEEDWWNNLQWDDEATQSAFLPYFKSIGQ